MLKIRELNRWDKLLTPGLVPLFFRTGLAATIIVGLFGTTSGLILLPDNAAFGTLLIAFTLCLVSVAVLMLRLTAEYFLISFRSSNHLNIIRQLLEGAEQRLSYPEPEKHDFPEAA
jgi:uncharacterized protein DUF4282